MFLLLFLVFSVVLTLFYLDLSAAYIIFVFFFSASKSLKLLLVHYPSRLHLGPLPRTKCESEHTVIVANNYLLLKISMSVHNFVT